MEKKQFTNRNYKYATERNIIVKSTNHSVQKN